VDAVGVLPLGEPSRAEVAVHRRGKRLSEASTPVDAVTDRQVVLHRLPETVVDGFRIQVSGAAADDWGVDAIRIRTCLGLDVDRSCPAMSGLLPHQTLLDTAGGTRLVDEVIERYVAWRKECEAVRTGYEAWSSGAGEERTFRFAVMRWRIGARRQTTHRPSASGGLGRSFHPGEVMTAERAGSIGRDRLHGRTEGPSC
jgi:hypothetical protein